MNNKNSEYDHLILLFNYVFVSMKFNLSKLHILEQNVLLKSIIVTVNISIHT